jgi:Anti-sigma-K factor rskA
MSGIMDEMDGGSDNYELEELLGAYALDAVDGDEKRRVEDYLRINPRAAAEVQQHREVATMLAFTGMDAPADVWSRIENEIESSAPAPGPELARVLAIESGSSSGGRDSRRRLSPGAMLGVAASLALLAVGFVAIAGRSNGSSDPIAQAYADASDADNSSTIELAAEGSAARAIGVIDADGHGYLDADALPALDAGMTYQLWGVLADTDDVVSIGIMGSDPGLETFTVDGSVAALALTIEQSPGVISDGNPEGAYVGAFE